MHFHYMKKIVVVLSVLFASHAYADGDGYNARFPTADSTRLSSLHVQANVKVQPYMLAQGTVSTYDWPYDVYNRFTTVQRCGNGTYPVLDTNIKTTYGNAFYAIGGIINTLRLTPSYRLVGSLYESNIGALGGNTRSSATASWQIWCQPLRNA